MMSVLPALLLAAAGSGGGKLAIVELSALDSLNGIGSQVTRALVDSAGTQKLDFVGPDALRTQLGEKKYNELKACGKDLGCVSSALAGTEFKRVVTGLLSRDEKNYLLKLWLIDLNSQSIVADIDRVTLIASRRFQRDAEQAVPGFLRGEREARGTLELLSNVKNTQVFVNGEFVGVAPQKLERKPGKYEVRMERKKYLPVTRLLSVEAQQTSTEKFQMLLMPGELPDEQEVPGMVAPEEKTAAKGEPIKLSTGTWFCGAVTLVGFGVATYFAATAARQDAELTAGLDARTGVYKGTRRQAQLAQQNAIIANVLFGVGGAAAIGTAILLILDVTRKDEVAPAVTLAPSFTSGGLAFSLQGSF